MRFSRLLPASIAFLIAALSGCSWSQDRPKPLLNLQQGALNLSCLQKASPDLHELFQGNLTESPADQERAAGIWKCLDRALEVFSKYTEGAEPDAFLADELQKFANHFMKEDQQVDDSFRNSIFRLKTAVLGGSPERITQTEIANLRNNLLRFGAAITPLAPELRVLLHPDQHDTPRRERALQALRRFTGSLAEIFGESIHPLQWVELAGFASDLERYIHADAPTALTLIHEQKDLLRNLKVLLVGGSESMIEPSKWKPILDGFSSTIGTFLMARNSSEMIEKINFRFLSTPREQAKAIQSLGKEFKRLKALPTLKTHALISQLADYYIKGRLLLEFALPEGKTPLSLNLLFDDTRLRNSEGLFIRKLFPANPGENLDLEPARWMEQVRLILRQLDQTLFERTGRHSSFSLARLQKICNENLELFADRRMGNQVLAGIPLFLTFHSILNHKSGDEIFLSDLDPILEKAGQFLEQPFQQDVPIQENFNRILTIMKRKPEITTIEKSSLKDVLPNIAPMITEILKTQVSADDLSQILEIAFQTKSLLWGTSRERWTLEDFNEIGFLLENFEEIKHSPAAGLETLRSRWSRPGVDPALSLVDLEKIAGSPLARIPALAPLRSLTEHSRSIQVARRFLLGTESDLLRLCELSEMLGFGERILTAAKGMKLRNLANIIDELLAKPGALQLTAPELGQVLHSIETLKPGAPGRVPLALPAAFRIKHEWFGTPEDALVRDDFIYLRQLLLLKDGGIPALVGFFDLLQKRNTLNSSKLDLQSLRGLILSLQETETGGSISSAPETPAALAFLDEAIQLKKTLFADPEPVLKSRELKRWIDQWLSVQRKPALAKVRTLLSLLLEIAAPSDIQRGSLVELLSRASTLTERLGGKPLDSTRLQRQLDLMLRLKSVILGTPETVITRKELELIQSLLSVRLGAGSPRKKAAAYGRLLTPFLRRPIQIADLANAVAPVVSEFNLSGELPIRPSAANLRRLKLLLVGGSPSTLTPPEFIALIQKSATATSAGDWITQPAFKLDAASFLWVESALALAIESGRSIGLKEAYENIEKAVQTSGKNLKLPMEESLFGIWYHVLEGKKGLLPYHLRTANGIELSDEYRINTAHLRMIQEWVHAIGLRLQDLEQAYGAYPKLPENRANLLQRLKSQENIRLVRISVPTLRIIHGERTLRLEETIEAGGDFLLEELAYKAVLSEALKFLFSRYNIRNSDPILNVPEFALLLADLRVPMINFGILYKSGPPAVVAQKQMATINLMTRSGNGNDRLEVDETVEFMNLGWGTSSSFKHLIEHLSGTCRSFDVSGIPGFEGSCVIRNLFTPAVFEKIYGSSLPGTVRTYSRLTGKSKTAFELATLRLTGKNLLHEKPRSILDVFTDRTLNDYTYVSFDYDMLQSINSVHPLLEGVFQMMDSNNNQKIELAEALAYFPRFCPAIQAAAKGKISGNCGSAANAKELKKLFGYLLVHKEKPGVGFYFWGNTWAKIQAGEEPFAPLSRYDMIAILSNLAP